MVLHADEMATVWIVRGGDRDRLVKTFLDEGAVGIAYPDFPDGATVDRSKAIKLLGGGLEPSKAVEAEAALFLSFVRRISVADVVLLPDHRAGGFAAGVVTGDYQFREELPAERNRHRRPVDWRRRLPFTELPERLSHLSRPRHDLTDVPDGRLRSLALQCCRGEIGEDPFDRPAGAAPVPRARRSSGTRAPAKPKAPTRAERRCANCLITKPEDLFEDGGDFCQDCQ